jgi:tRNA 2-thiouridine synthesizing protein E
MSIAIGTRTRNEPALAALERDEEGFLCNAHDWHPDVIEAFADEGGLAMTSERCEIADYSRNCFKKNLGVPKARILLRPLHTVWDKGKATRRYLCQLFPRGYG